MRLLSFDTPRLPTLAELKSLLWNAPITEGTPEYAALLHALRIWWPQASLESSLLLWSNTTAQGDNTSAWAVDMAHQHGISLPRQSALPILLVSNAATEFMMPLWRNGEPPGLRYVLSQRHPNAVWDRKTGLLWQRPKADKKFTWVRAVTEFLAPPTH